VCCGEDRQSCATFTRATTPRRGLTSSVLSKEGDSKMMRIEVGANLLKMLLATGLVLGSSGVAGAQSLSDLRPSWSTDAMDKGWQSVCGDVRNVGRVPARSVAIRVQGLDSAGQAVSARDRYINADVPVGSRSVFCVPMPAGAASYTVTILGADWGFAMQGP
jgi:hypothetical protein